MLDVLEIKSVEVIRNGVVVPDAPPEVEPEDEGEEEVPAEMEAPAGDVESPLAPEAPAEPAPPTPEDMLAALKAKGRSRVCIIGFTPSRNLAPYQNEDFEIWALNDLFEAIPRCDRLFQIHSRRDVDTHTTRGEKATYIKRLRELQMPIYMIEKYPDIPNSIAYPLDEIIAEFGNYFTNTISYMIALAIYEGFQEVHVYGVDMAVGTEFEHQRPSCEYHLGIAKGRGIKVYLPNDSDLLKARFLYGFEQDKEEAFNAKCTSSIKMMGERMDGARRQAKQLTENINKYDGATQLLAEISKGVGPEMDPAKFAGQLQNVAQSMAREKERSIGQLGMVMEVVHKYEGASQAISEMRRTWSTCLEHKGLFDAVPQSELEAAGLIEVNHQAQGQR